jgi:SOS-response transcriptional repressor LexA
MTDHPESPRHRDEPPSTSARAREIESEREADQLVRLLGDRALVAVDPVSEVGAVFHEWWARDLRRRTSGPELDAHATEFESRVRSRVAATAHRVRTMTGAPMLRRPPVYGTVASSLVAAAAEGCAPVLDLGVAAGVGRELWDEPCTSWLELPTDASPGQHVALTVRGESMEPLLHAGDTILVKLGPELRRESVVVARRPDDGYVVKRVARVGRRVVELASFNAGYPPIRIPRRDDLILGTVLMCWRAQAG